MLVHGGAWNIPLTETDDHLAGLREALARGRSMLLDGASARDVVVETVAVMEAHGAFDAGVGAVLTREGTVELDAGVMDGASLEFGAVAGVRRLMHPVRAARAVLEEGRGEVRLMVGEAAEQFAAATGCTLVAPETLICARERRRFEKLHREQAYHTSRPFLPDAPKGTVGCVVRDRHGRLAAATSTGGTPFRPSGRVGDSPLPGAGFYASEEAAASATGWGEAIAAVLLCGRAVDDVARQAAPEDVARKRLHAMYERIRNVRGEGATGGLILLGRDGTGAWAFTTPRMARGGWREGEEPWAVL